MLPVGEHQAVGLRYPAPHGLLQEKLEALQVQLEVQLEVQLQAQLRA